MQILQHPYVWPAVALGLTFILMATLACGSTAEPGPPASGSTDAPAASDHGKSAEPGQATQGESQTDEVVINLPIAARATTLTRNDLRVSQGDTVRLALQSDEDGEVHLHGYDLTADVSPGHPGELVVQADIAGAFALNFHVFGPESSDTGGHHHGGAEPEAVVSETPVSVQITAESDGQAGVNVNIVAEGFRFAPDLVDQPHTPGAGHAHIYADGVKLGRVFQDEYHIDQLAPGEHEIRVTLNTNDHGELEYDGKKVEALATVTVPDVGQGRAASQDQPGSDGHAHSHGDHAGREIIAEVHLGNLEVYP